MTVPINPAASHNLPVFITAPGDTDVLMVVTALFLLGAVLAFGILFLRLHSLPERIAHRAHRLQFEIVAVLALIALFTHIHAFWVAALILALIDIPDFGGWMGRIARAVERIAGIKPEEPEGDARRADAMGPAKKPEGDGAPQQEAIRRPASEKELTHA